MQRGFHVASPHWLILCSNTCSNTLHAASRNQDHFGRENWDHQLKLAVAWNRVDIARSEIFTDDHDWKVWPNLCCLLVRLTACQACGYGGHLSPWLCLGRVLKGFLLDPELPVCSQELFFKSALKHPKHTQRQLLFNSKPVFLITHLEPKIPLDSSSLWPLLK